jgi:hypothetical protein
VQIKEHVLLPFADQLEAADALLAPRLTPELITSIVGLIPDDWLGDVEQFANVEEHRAAYISYLLRRLETPRVFVEEARHARSLHL